MSKVLGKWIANIFKQETPSGTVNGSNTAFTLSETPIFSSVVILFVNGVLQEQTTHYTISGSNITFITAPETDSRVYAYYIKR